MQPVTHVTWYCALAMPSAGCEDRIAWRLPLELEWEKAAGWIGGAFLGGISLIQRFV